jgi:hypothetical protein
MTSTIRAKGEHAIDIMCVISSEKLIGERCEIFRFHLCAPWRSLLLGIFVA